MESTVETTYLEQFMDSIELLPNDVRRDFELMKELDRDAIDANRELIEAQNSMLTKLRSGKRKKSDGTQSDELMKDIEYKRSRAKQKQDEKVAVAQNLLSTIEKFIKKVFHVFDVCII